MTSDAAVDQRVVRLWGRTALHVTLLVALVGFTSWLGYTGFIASDDWSYSEAAIGWLDHFPYVGTNHWGLRHAVVLPVALSFLLSGINEVSMILPTRVYLVLLVLLTYSCLTRLLEVPSGMWLELKGCAVSGCRNPNDPGVERRWRPRHDQE